MQDRYAGDVGDFVKFAMLRVLSPSYCVGVVWYLAPDEGHNADGKHTDYLKKIDWRQLDPELFDSLAEIANGERPVAALEQRNLVDNCRYFASRLPLRQPRERSAARSKWLEAAVEAVRECDLVFLDPDNGLQPSGFHPQIRRPSRAPATRTLPPSRERDGR